MNTDKKLHVFVSYSHRDKPRWLERVQKHLKPLARDGKLDLWDDTRIRAGERWRQEIEAALARADVAILLISADFYASAFIATEELPPLLEAEQSERGLKILGVHIDPSVSSMTRCCPNTRRSIRRTGRSGAWLAGDEEKVFEDLARRIEEIGAAAQRPITAPPIPPDYLAWPEKRCAGVALLGQDVQQSHAFTLSHVYVPALTLPEAAVAIQRDARDGGASNRRSGGR